MSSAKTYSKMLNMSLDELIKEYDETSQTTVIGLDFIKQEIWRREGEKINRRIYHLTIVITLLTAISAFFVVYSVFS